MRRPPRDEVADELGFEPSVPLIALGRGQAAQRQDRQRVRRQLDIDVSSIRSNTVRDGMAAARPQAASLPGGRPRRMVHARRGARKRSTRDNARCSIGWRSWPARNSDRAPTPP